MENENPNTKWKTVIKENIIENNEEKKDIKNNKKSKVGGIIGMIFSSLSIIFVVYMSYQMNFFKADLLGIGQDSGGASPLALMLDEGGGSSTGGDINEISLDTGSLLSDLGNTSTGLDISSSQLDELVPQTTTETSAIVPTTSGAVSTDAEISLPNPQANSETKTDDMSEVKNILDQVEKQNPPSNIPPNDEAQTHGDFKYKQNPNTVDPNLLKNIEKENLSKIGGGESFHGSPETNPGEKENIVLDLGEYEEKEKILEPDDGVIEGILFKANGNYDYYIKSSISGEKFFLKTKRNIASKIGKPITMSYSGDLKNFKIEKITFPKNDSGVFSSEKFFAKKLSQTGPLMNLFIAFILTIFSMGFIYRKKYFCKKLI